MVAVAENEQITVADLFVSYQRLNEPGRVGERTAEAAVNESIYRSLVRQMVDSYHDYDPAEIHRLARNRVHQPLMEYMFNDLFKHSVEIPEASVDSFYQANIEGYHRAEQRRATHLLVSTSRKAWETQGIDVSGLSDVELERRAQQRAEELYQQVMAGADLGELAAKYSQDSYSAEKSGDLGFFGSGEMVDEFEKVAFAMRVGEVSKPFKTRFGYHIVRLDEIIPEETQQLDETRRQEIKVYLEREAERQLALKFLDSLMTNAEYTWNEDLLQKKVGEFGDHDWVCIVNGVDSVEGFFLKNWELRVRTRDNLPDLTADGRKEMLVDKLSPNVLMAYAIESGYYDSDSGKALYDFYRRDEIASRIHRLRTKADWEPSEEELRNYYDAHLDEFQAEKPIKIRQIVFTDSISAARAKAELSDSVDFDSLARKYYPGEKDIKEAAFDLGWISGDEMGEPFFKAVWIGRTGDIIGPVRTDWGYHLVEIVDRKELLSFEGAKRQIAKTLQQQRREQVDKEWIDWVTAGKDIEIFEDILAQIDLKDYNHYVQVTDSLKQAAAEADSAS
ncbi:MAG: peptidylprolyl isomerase [bacterium]